MDGENKTGRASFTDASGRAWALELDALAIERIRADCDPRFMLGGECEQHTFRRLRADPVLLCRVIYLLAEAQREELGISEKEFYLGVLRSGIASATNALLESMMDFKRPIASGLMEAAAAKYERASDATGALPYDPRTLRGEEA